MIGSFWNLCRACPAMPDKLHSEYRSTYRWHEYVGPRQDVVRKPPPIAAPPPAPAPAPAPAPSSSAPAPAPAPISTTNTAPAGGALRAPGIARRVVDPTLEGAEPAMPRRRKHPALAHRSHEWASAEGYRGAPAPPAPPPAPPPSAARRSRSEGPPTNRLGRFDRSRSGSQSPAWWRSRSRDDYVDATAMVTGRGLAQQQQAPPPANAPAPTAPSALAANATPAAGLPSRRGNTEYHYHFAWPKGGRGRGPGAAAAAGGSMAAVAAALMAGAHEIAPAGLPSDAAPRKSLSMGALKATAAAQQSVKDKTDGLAEELPLLNDADNEELKIREENLGKEEKSKHRTELNTEYKKKFRPFSQYDYVEGKFLPKKAGSDEPDPSWYREVVELRRKAGEYRHRGWGTELAPQHIVELYREQMLLWEQVSRRSSLSALSLASSTPRAFTKEEKDHENSRKSSPTKPHGRRPHTARERLKDDNRKEDGARPSRKDNLLRHHLDRTVGAADGVLLASPTREKLEPVVPRSQHPGRSQSVGPSAGSTPAAECRSPKRAPKAPGTAERRARPTTLNTSAPSRSKSRTSPLPKVEEGKLSTHQTTKKPNQSKTASETSAPHAARLATKASARRGKSNLSTTGESPSRAAAETTAPATVPPAVESDSEPEVDPEPLVKSPPEPTRVKSPEQIMMRSPEPVNWTVPLDTGKTFTVTQNVPEGDPLRPHSENASSPPSLTLVSTNAPTPTPTQASATSSADAASSLPTKPAAVEPTTVPKAMNGVEDEPSSSDETGLSSRPQSSQQFQPPPASLPQEATSGAPVTKGGYRVLEAPDMPLVSPTSGRSLASDVLDKARNRFDKFWGKDKDDQS